MTELDNQKTVEKQKTTFSKKDKIVAASVLTIIIGMLIAGIVFRKDIAAIDNLNRYSLVGLLIITIIACSPLSVTAIPIPYLLVVFTLPSMLAETWGLLAPVWVGAIAAVGATTGQTPTFFIGYSSKSISEKLLSRISKKVYDKALSWIKKYGLWTVYIVSTIPNPVHLPVTVILGAAKFSPVRWVILSFAGNLTKCVIIAFTGYYGVDIVLRLLGQ